MDRYQTFAKLLTSKSLPRSTAYQEGLAAELRYRQEKVTISCPYISGTPEYDAFFAGVQHADLFLQCANYGDQPDIDIRDAWEALQQHTAQVAA